MINREYIELIEETPTLNSKKCKLISFVIKSLLRYSSFTLMLFAWYLYDYFVAIATLLLAFIIIGIVRSKISNSVIPPSQREYQYSDKEIANWYTYREFCFDEVD